MVPRGKDSLSWYTTSGSGTCCGPGTTDVFGSEIKGHWPFVDLTGKPEINGSTNVSRCAAARPCSLLSHKAMIDTATVDIETNDLIVVVDT
jgi:hypothetical protein